ncbi:MAG: ferritin family protein [Proteobacteria bacterium]|nr:ferritin family protein [Pseudomonadota bacterium]
MDMITFLAHAVRLELEAEKAYRKAASAMDMLKNVEAAAFFRQMGEYSHLHYQEAMRRAGFNDLSEMPALEFRWPDNVAAESLGSVSDDEILDLEAAIGLALGAERRGVDFYVSIGNAATDPQVKALAEEIAGEEREHVTALERFMAWKPILRK